MYKLVWLSILYTFIYILCGRKKNIEHVNAWFFKMQNRKIVPDVIL